MMVNAVKLAKNPLPFVNMCWGFVAINHNVDELARVPFLYLCTKKTVTHKGNTLNSIVSTLNTQTLINFTLKVEFV